MVQIVSSVLLLRIVGIAMAMVWFMLLVRLMPMQQVGVYSAINAFWVLLRALGPLGSDQALMQRLPELLQQGKVAQAHVWQRYALRFMLRLLLPIMCVAALLACVWAPWPWVLMVTAGGLLYSMNGQQLFVLLAAKRPLLANALETFWLPLCLSAVALVLHANAALTLPHLLLVQLSLMLGFCAITQRCAKRALGSTATTVALSATQKSDFAKASRQLFFTAAFIHANVRMPVMLAPFFIGAAATALLEAAVRFASLLGLLGVAAGQVYLPRISALCTQANKPALQRLLVQASWLVFVPTVLLYAALVVCGKPLLVLLTQASYAQAYMPMLVVGFAYVVNASAGPMQHCFTMSKKGALVSKISLLEMALSISLMWLCTVYEQAQAMGMALAMAAGILLRNILLHTALARVLHLHAGVWSLKACKLLLQKRGKFWQVAS